MSMLSTASTDATKSRATRCEQAPTRAFVLEPEQQQAMHHASATESVVAEALVLVALVAFVVVAVVVEVVVVVSSVLVVVAFDELVVVVEAMAK
jgi:Flp pilus assembly protein TadB